MPMLLPPMLLLLLLPLPLALGAGAADAACPGFVLKQGYGMTHQGHYATFATADAPACCAKCAADAKCNAWTYHPNGGAEACALGVAAAQTPTRSAGSVGAYRAGHAPDPERKPPAPDPEAPCAATAPSPPAKAGSANIVLFLMDDMDLKLGSWKALTKATKLLSEQGATAENWMIHTPVCCPSRSELVTGRYFHNIRNKEPTDGGCMHVNVTQTNDFYSKWYFGPHLQQAGYTVGIFGKHLNNNNPACPPPGIDRWFANGGGNYFSPSFAWASAGAGLPETAVFNNCTYNNGSCYSTSVIANQSIAWLKELQADPDHKPFFAYIAVKAPHIQDGPGWPVTLPAPWYNDTFPGLTAPRTPNWNASCPKHHWMIRTQPPMTDEQALHSDELYRARWQSLLSVDDMVEGVVAQVEAMGAHKTYYIFSSDHGYRFGQYRMPQGKWNSYDNDLRIPFVIRGPGIMPGSTFKHIATQVDTMPTILGLAGVSTPATMDGRSIAHLLVTDAATAPAPVSAFLNTTTGGAQPWRTSQLIEYYGLGAVVRYEHLEDNDNNTFRTLRVIDPDAPKGEQNLKLSEFVSWANWDFLEPADPSNEFELFNLDAV